MFAAYNVQGENLIFMFIISSHHRFITGLPVSQKLYRKCEEVIIEANMYTCTHVHMQWSYLIYLPVVFVLTCYT